VQMRDVLGYSVLVRNGFSSHTKKVPRDAYSEPAKSRSKTGKEIYNRLPLSGCLTRSATKIHGVILAFQRVSGSISAPKRSCYNIIFVINMYGQQHVTLYTCSSILEEIPLK
jgi:hypothetical protein